MTAPSPEAQAVLTRAPARLIYEAIRFSVWAASQGISPDAGEPCEEPETFLFQYARATEDGNYDGYAEKLSAYAASERGGNHE